ncbi:hypothetical protein [uncultured Marinobacter sp.]|uniref:head-tail joining protein n=1 Tax=uncultured Marinobacter sp. TaxID=187379 RepID=UPI0030D7DFE0
MSDRHFKKSARRILQSMGTLGNLHRYSGGSVADVLIHISRDVQIVTAGETETAETRDEAELLTEEVGALKKRDEIHVGAQIWRVESKIANDGYTIRVVVSEQ